MNEQETVHEDVAIDIYETFQRCMKDNQPFVILLGTPQKTSDPNEDHRFTGWVHGCEEMVFEMIKKSMDIPMQGGTKFVHLLEDALGEHKLYQMYLNLEKKFGDDNHSSKG